MAFAEAHCLPTSPKQTQEQGKDCLTLLRSFSEGAPFPRVWSAQSGFPEFFIAPGWESQPENGPGVLSVLYLEPTPMGQSTCLQG